MDGRTPLWRQLGILLVGTSLLVPESPLGYKVQASTAPAAPGALAVASDPQGADVFLDGQFAGETPLTIHKVTAGDHRVRLVKDGYLENARLVTIDKGRSASLQVRLTHVRSDASALAPAGQVSTTGGGGGGGSRKWLWIGIAGGGAAAAIIGLKGDDKKNAAPVPGTVVVSPGNIGLAAGTIFTFTSQGASDAENDPLTFTWNFGDGGSATGATATHTYTSAGNLAVSLNVSDGHTTSTATSLVTIKDLTGAWTGTLGVSSTFTATITQTGTALTGSSAVAAGSNASGNLSGSVSTQRITLNLLVGNASFTPIVLSGSADANVNTVSGTVLSGFTTSNPTFSMHR